MEPFDILIIGGGAAGIAAAKAAWDAGCRNLLLADRNEGLGGILRQCAHHGFGAGQDGPGYAQALIRKLPLGITLWSHATVTEVKKDRTARILGPEIGARTVSFRELILATGCREIPMGAVPIVGTRPQGIFTAGQMQEMMNLHGFQPQGPAVILGSGDLGLILANQLAQTGLDVTLVEKQSRCGGLVRNQKCLTLPNVRLLCNVTIEEVFGLKQLDRVSLSDGTTLPCRTLLIAIGLRPEQELIRDLGRPDWLHLCGNCRRVHPMIEGVILEGTQAGHAAAKRAGEPNPVPH